MAECVISEPNKNITDSSKQSSDVQSCQDVKTEKVMEPLLLEEFQRSQVPTSLKNCLTCFERQGTVPSKTEFLVGAIYIFMLEYGFIPQAKEITIEDCGFNFTRVKELASFPGWKQINETSYSLSFILAPHQLYVCKVTCIKIGDDLVINAFVKNIDNVQHTIMIDTLTYFTDGSYNNADLKRVQNLRPLSILFKNQIAFPVRHAILRKNEIRHPCFEDLPLEIIFYIFKFFRGSDIVRFTATCKQFYLMRQETKLWENLIFRDFGVTVQKNHSCDDLITQYARLYKTKSKYTTEGLRKKGVVISNIVV